MDDFVKTHLLKRARKIKTHLLKRARKMGGRRRTDASKFKRIWLDSIDVYRMELKVVFFGGKDCAFSQKALYKPAYVRMERFAKILKTIDL